jgi:photosystem II stability/assembly factor-like uncharacterized protein
MDVRGALVAKAGVSLFVSDDNGDSWEEVDIGNGDLASAVTISSAKIIFVGTETGRVVRVERARNGWANANVTTLASPRNAFISDIVVLGPASRTIWVSCSPFGGGHVFRSVNGGTSWTDRSGNLPDIPVNAIVVDPSAPQHLYAATDHGVYQTLNTGGRWRDFSNGLPNVVVGDMILHERRRILRVGTRSRGAWELNI